MARTPILSTVAALAISGLMAAAQPESPAPLTLAEAVNTASKNYPSIRVSQEQMNAAAKGFAWRGRPICRALTHWLKSIALPATTSSDYCCRKTQSPPCEDRSS